MRVDLHLERNGMRNYEQAGFTAGGSILDNLVILREGVDESFRRREKLVVIAVDFKKAFDSVKRDMIVRMMRIPIEWTGR